MGWDASANERAITKLVVEVVPPGPQRAVIALGHTVKTASNYRRPTGCSTNLEWRGSACGCVIAKLTQAVAPQAHSVPSVRRATV